MRLWNYIKEAMTRYPEQKIREDETSLTFEEAAIWAELFACKLNEIHCCAILCSSELATAISLLACFAAGVTAVPLSIRYGQAHCNKILDTIKPDAIIMDTNGELSVFAINNSEYIEPDIHPALIMCTSGTTGKPKGVMLSENNIITNVTDIADYFTLYESDSILIARPLYHCAVLTGEFLTALVKGSSICFYSGTFNPAILLNLIKQYQITTFCGTPTMLSIMAKFQRRSYTDSLRNICISGECLGADTGLKIIDAFPLCNIYHVYGLTEASPRVCYLPPQQFQYYPDCVGIPLKSVSIKILNQVGQLCHVNEEGVLFIKGDNVMFGYYEEPNKTRDILADGWLCTGDVALINDAGYLKIIGRSDDLIIKAGMNIYPTEIEAVLKQDARVKEVLVYGYQSNVTTHIGLKIAGDFQTVDEVKRLCIQMLPPYQIPSAIELTDEIPKSGSGKIVRRI